MKSHKCQHLQAVTDILFRSGGKTADALADALVREDDEAAAQIVNGQIQNNLEYLLDEGFIASFTPPETEVHRCDGCGNACVRSSGLLVLQQPDTQDADD